MGLSFQEAANRIEIFGPNQFNVGHNPSILRIFLEQLDNYTSKVLLGLAGLSIFLGKTANALMGSGVLLANTALGVAQEYRAEKSLKMLGKLTPAKSNVIREAKAYNIPTENLVPGDIITLSAGDRVPADACILQSASLWIDEASLTGESLPVFKQADVSGNSGTVFMGTKAVQGSALAVVIYTGQHTEMGAIARSIDRKNYYCKSPVYRRIDEVGHTLVNCGLLVSGLAFAAGLFHRQRLDDIIVNATSLAVSVIPDGLIPFITLTMALGSMHLARQGVLVREMPAVDALGCINVLCADKTGTLTQNKMEVQKLACPGEKIRGLDEIKPESHVLKNLFRCAVLCNNARVVQDRKGRWQTTGDSTEAALLVAAARLGQTAHNGEFQRIKELPFTPLSRQMIVTCEDEYGRQWDFIKGAPEVILPNCQWLEDEKGNLNGLQDAQRDDFKKQAEHLSQEGLRVLAFAYSAVGSNSPEAWIFLGSIGIKDPLRSGAKEAVSVLKHAHVKTLMLSGDHKGTALATAKQLGIVDLQSSLPAVVTGEDIEKFSDVEMRKALGVYSVYARMTPRQKLRLVSALKASGRIVAMMGDGVNDAPSVREAHVGIAVGLKSEEVTKKIAPVVFARDDLGKLPAAIREGRTVYDNIRKCMRYSLTTNLGDGIVIIWSALLGRAIPILPQQLLWIDFTSDPAIFWLLANDKPHQGVMHRIPRKTHENILGQGLGRRITTRSLILGLSAIAVDGWSKKQSHNLGLSRTLTMATLTLGRMLHLVDCRHLGKAFGKPAPNPKLAYMGVWMLAPILAAIYIPWLQPIFQTVPLAWSHWQAAIAGSAAGFLADNVINIAADGKWKTVGV